VSGHAAQRRQPCATVLKGAQDPGYKDEQPQEGAAEPSVASLDLEQAASDEIVAFIRAHFPGHDLARLVDGILQAEGFITRRAAPGP
jgi:hypothetical protein